MEWTPLDTSAMAEKGKYREMQILGFPYYQDGFEAWNYWEQEEWLHSIKDFSENTVTRQETNWSKSEMGLSGHVLNFELMCGVSGLWAYENRRKAAADRTGA